MTRLITLINRNVRLFFCDRAAVFFSLLGAMIAIFLVLFFLKSGLVDSLTDGYGGLVTRERSGHVLDAWLIASACVIASATTGLGALRQFVEDRETSRWRDFLVTPLPRWAITLGYLLGATIVSMLMTTAVYALGTLYCLIMGVPLAALDVLVGWGWLMLCSISFTSLMGFVVSWLRTVGAFTGLGIVVGVLFGFLAETYVNTASLPDTASRILHCLPFAQASALVREPFTAHVIASLPEEVRDITKEAMGITISVGSTAVTTSIIVMVLVAMTIIGSVLAWQIMARTVKS